ncbi:MAG: hypothetical protein JXR37_28870 [Kiritimatiellae bacterium]|nr:hypothetical protein [Kiritimatiellia bacterium]
MKWGDATYSTLSAWRDATGQETVGGINTALTGNPTLTDPGGGGTIGDPYQLHTLSAYRLLAVSPLIDAGLDLFSEFGIQPGSRDFYGNSLPSTGMYDAGAHEVVAGPAAPTGLRIRVP